MRFWLAPLILILVVSCKKEFPNVQTEVIGHAGESLHLSKSKFPPNTLESVQRAISLGVDGVEIDVQMTNNGTLVAWHDLTLDENSSRTGCVHDLTTLEILSTYVYNTTIHMYFLEHIATYVLGQNKKLMLDVKHYNACSDSNIDFDLFNYSLNELLDNYSQEQKQLITVNSTNPTLLLTLTDTLINKSLESDKPGEAIETAKTYNFDMLTLKLEVMDETIRSELKSNNIDLSIFKVKARLDINRALEYDPEFVITDNVPCTIEAIHGK